MEELEGTALSVPRAEPIAPDRGHAPSRGSDGALPSSSRPLGASAKRSFVPFVVKKTPPEPGRDAGEIGLAGARTTASPTSPLTAFAQRNGKPNRPGRGYGTEPLAGALEPLSPPFRLRAVTTTLIAVPPATALRWKVASLSCTISAASWFGGVALSKTVTR